MPDDSLDFQSDQLFDVYRIIRLIIDDIDEDSLSNKVIDKYDIHALESVSTLAGSLVMLTQIISIFTKDPKPVNFFTLQAL